MALAKERATRNPQLQGFDPSTLDYFGFKGHNASTIGEDGGCSDHLGSYPYNNAGFAFGAVNSPLGLPAVSWAHSNSSVLSFNQDEDYSSNSCLTKDVTCFEEGSGYASTSNGKKDENRFGLLYSKMNDVDQDDGEQESDQSRKRDSMGENMQASKKHCDDGRKAKGKHTSTKDPQSVAAKNRRERISERLKALQELVPNGTKVDLVTMLEKAISYVKFLQLQVKVLATDEFWPAQGVNAPEVAQVKEAIDAILASHRNGS